MMNRSLRSALVLLGVSALFTAYYVWHPPFTQSSALALGGAALDLATGLLIFAVCGGLGRTLLRPVPLAELSTGERLGIEGLVGFGGLSLLALALGLLGLFTQPVLWGVLLAVGALTALDLARYLTDTVAACRKLTPATPWTRFLAALVAFWLGTALIIGLMPPTTWDSIMYHMPLPQRLVETGTLSPYPDSHYFGFPQGTEMMFAWALALFGRDTASALMHYGIGVLGIVVTCGLLSRHTSARAGWLAAALLLSGSGFWLSLTQEYVDLTLFATSAGVLAGLVAWRQDENRRWLVLIGILLGVAVGSKYTAALLAIATVVVLAVSRPRRLITSGLIVGSVALLVYLPWALRGYAQYGNPFYPYIVGGIEWSAERSAFFSGEGGGLLSDGPTGWVQVPLLPIMSTVIGLEGRERYSYDTGLWLMPLALLVLLGWRTLRDEERPLVNTAGLLLLPMLVMWMLAASFSGISAHARRVIIVFPAFVVLGVIGFQTLPRWGRKPLDMSVLLRGAIAVSLVLNAIITLRDFTGYAPGWMLTLPNPQSGETPAQVVNRAQADYVFRQVGIHYPALQALEEVFPADAQVRMLFEPRPYYCPPTIYCDPDALTDHWSHAIIVDELSPDEVMNQWRDEVDGVLLWTGGYRFYTELLPYQPEQNRLLPAALAEHMQLAWTDGIEGGYEIYVWAEG